MTSKFTPGQILQQDDLGVKFVDSNGSPTNVYSISFSLFYVDPGPPETEILIPPANRTPVNPLHGSYYPSIMIPPSANEGNYRIRWYFEETSSQVQNTIVEEFEVVSPGTELVHYTTYQKDLIRQLRVFLRDQNPDRNYRFRPPEHEGRIGKYNRVFGQIWEDEELLQYLQWALDWWNMMPPETEYLCTIDALYTQKPAWRTSLLWGAAIHALFALTLNWIHDEFSVTGDTLVNIIVNGKKVSIPIENLYNICRCENYAPQEHYIYDAYLKGKIFTQSLNLENNTIEEKQIVNVLKHFTPQKDIIEVILENGAFIKTTQDHSVFSKINGKITPIETKDLKLGSKLIFLENNEICELEVVSLQKLEKEKYTYDLSVKDNENFFITNGILAHNSYSIGGISLDIEKSSKYESLKQNAETQFEKAGEYKQRTTIIMRGLQQSRYGAGVRSSFGPYTGRGVLSPRNFIGY